SGAGRSRRSAPSSTPTSSTTSGRSATCGPSTGSSCVAAQRGDGARTGRHQGVAGGRHLGAATIGLMSEQVTLRSIGVGVYLPTMLYGVGQGAMVPIIAHSARDLGASVGVAGLVVAAIGVGQLIGDLPAGALAGRIGERRAMLAAAALDVVAMAACVIAGSVWLLGAAIFCAGLAGAVWGLARQAYLAEVVPFHLRARAMSTLGGVHRIGRFIGPFLGAGVVRAWGTDGAYAMNGIAVLAAAALLVSLPEPQGRHPHRSEERRVGKER